MKIQIPMKLRQDTSPGGRQPSVHHADCTLDLPPQTDDSHASACILLVDDDRTVRESLEGVLVAEGYAVIPAENGEQALKIASRTPVDLVLLDLNMPVKNGWDTFDECTREHPLIPIIVVTARPNQLFTAVSAGVGALLEKPMEIPTLLKTMEKLLLESAQQRLERLAGKNVVFYYKSASGSEELSGGTPAEK